MITLPNNPSLYTNADAFFINITDTIVDEPATASSPVYTRMYVCSGFVRIDFTTDGDWRRDKIRFTIPDPESEATEPGDPGPIEPGPMLLFPPNAVGDRIVATVVPAAFGFEESDIGGAVDNVDAFFDPANGRVWIDADVAVKGKKCVIFTLSYQVSFLTTVFQRG